MFRYLDEQEMYLSDHIDLSKTLPFASGMAMARGVVDSLMSAAYFNASLLKLLRLLVTGKSRVLCPRKIYKRFCPFVSIRRKNYSRGPAR